jgi:bile acid:Na+ symporter, BASS family
MFADILLPLALTLIMGSLGLTLTPADFRRVLTAPRGVGIGLANLLLVSPLLAFGIGEAYGLAATLAVGLVLLGASPGGTTANLLTHLARGDVALSVSMTAVSSVASVLTVPLYLGLAAGWFDAQDISDQISMPGIAARVFLITIVPLSIGMLIRAKRTAWTLRWMRTARNLALGAFVIVVAGAIATEIEVITDAFAEIAAAVVTLNILAMTVSFFVARAARLDERQSTAIAMELGVHNTTVALAVATSVGDELAGPAAVYGLFMFVTAGLFARFMSRRNARAAEAVTSTEAEVPGTPQAVWRAVATGDGLSAWFLPTRVGGGEVVMLLGGLGEARARVTAQDAPRRFAFVDDRWMAGAPPLETAVEVEAAGDGRCRVRVVNRVLGPAGEEARAALDLVRDSWRPHLAALRVHLAEHAGEPAHGVDVTLAAGGLRWPELLDALGVQAVADGEAPSPEAVVTGRTEHEGDRELVLRLEAPAAGHALVVVDDGPDGALATLGARFYGPGAEAAAAGVREAWERRAADRGLGAAAAV